MNYAHLSVDGYNEKDPYNTGLNLDIRSQSADSLTTSLGTQLSYAISTQVGVFLPKLGAEWEHEFMDDAYFITGSFVNDPDPLNPTTFDITTDSPTRDYFRLSPGVSMVFPRGISAFLNYDVLLGYDNFNSNNFTFGLRYEF